MPIGQPLPYDCAQYVHQIPGGVISNLRFQLAELRLQHRLQEVIEECVTIHSELGYPMMITPYSQFVGTQAALNVASGQRYKVVIDELLASRRALTARTPATSGWTRTSRTAWSAPAARRNSR